MFETYQRMKDGNTYNFQLHPPVGYDDDLVVNTLGNLDFSDVLIFDARVERTREGGSRVRWVRELPTDAVPTVGATRQLPYGGRGERPTQSTDVDDLVADITVVADLFPGILKERQDEEIKKAVRAEA